MRVKITIILIQYNSKSNIDNSNQGFAKVFFTNDNKFPCSIVSTKTENETLKEICSKHFKVDFNWLVKELADFRILNINGKMTAEAVYIINIPDIIGILKDGDMLSFEEIHDKKIEVDKFYERILTTSGRRIFR